MAREKNRIARFIVGIRTVKGEIVKWNNKTVWVRLGERIIKRHKDKHRVEIPDAY